MRGVEGRLLEGVAEPVDEDEDIASFGLRDQVANLSGQWFDRLDRPIPEPGRGQRKPLVARRHQLHTRETERTAVRSVPRLAATAVHSLARGGSENPRIGRKPRGIQTRAGGEAGAAAERESCARRGERT